MKALFAVGTALVSLSVASAAEAFRAGAFAVDITPKKFPVIINGGFLEQVASQANDRLHARAIVLEKGKLRLAIVVVDSCMMPRDLLDRAKDVAARRTGIPVDRMLISATHTHSAPAAMGCLGSDADSEYVRGLPDLISNAIEGAAGRLAPARAGWTTVDDFEHTHCRRWILRSDRMKADPFGAVTVRANMHPGYQNPEAIAPSGPVDPAISLLSLQTSDGRPLALLANYSMHYFGARPVSADYYGLFSASLAKRIGDAQSFVAIMSQGTSGDQMWMDYGQPKSGLTIQAYADQVADVVWRAWQNIQYHSAPELAMAETRLTLRRRTPDAGRLAWARELLANMAGAKPRNQPEVYAREQVLLHEDSVRELKLQALRVGDLGMTAIPNEVFAITGLKLKAQSPLRPTLNIELANGAEGYIPPPEQHKLGGYTTWPARTAALETEAEPKIVESVLELLEKISGQPRRKPVESRGPYVRSVLASRPDAYWRMSDFTGTTAADLVGSRHGTYEGAVAFYLPGPESSGFSKNEVNRAVHLAGGWFRAPIKNDGPAYTVELWFWNGLPNELRSVTAHLVAWGADRLTVSGKGSSPGRLDFGGLTGKTEIEPKTWHYLVFIRDGSVVRVYLNGKVEISGKMHRHSAGDLFVGSQGNSADTLEGSIDEVAVYQHALKRDVIERRYQLAVRGSNRRVSNGRGH